MPPSSHSCNETRLLQLAKRETKNGGSSQNSPYIEFKEKRLSPLLEIVNAIFYSSADKLKARNIAISKSFQMIEKMKKDLALLLPVFGLKTNKVLL
jgi:hypothetical protein